MDDIWLNKWVVGIGTKLAAVLIQQGAGRVKRQFAAPPRQQALERAARAALVALTAAINEQITDIEMAQHTAELLGRYLVHEEVAVELSRVLVGKEPDQDELRYQFDEMGYDVETVKMPFETVIDLFCTTLLEAAVTEPELQGEIQTGQLLAQTTVQQEIRDGVKRLAELWRVQPEAQVGIQAGAITATNVVQGTQIIYQPTVNVQNVERVHIQTETLNIATEHLTNIYLNAPANNPAEMDKAQFDETLVRYLSWVVERYGKLQLRGLEDKSQETVGSQQLDAVYVSLTADLAQRRGRVVDMRKLLPVSPRLAIVGGAGSGKTTYLRYIAALIAQAMLDGALERVKTTLGLTTPLPLPILITLGEYNLYRRACERGRHGTNKGTLTEFLNHSLIAQDAALRLPTDFFERLLVEGQGCLILLDGADEVADETERRIVIEQIESFASNQGVGRLIVTSRTRALRGDTGLPNFRLAMIQPMNEEEVAALVTRWCDAVYRAQDGVTEREKLLEQINTLERLRQQRGQKRLLDSPMLVTIVAIVHYNRTRLPDQRAELYDQCVTILVREAYKTAKVQAELEAYKSERRAWVNPQEWTDRRAWLAEVAWKMMSAGTRAGRDVTERQLKAWVVEILEEQDFEKRDAQKEANRFLHFLRERESVLEERSGTYRFIHLTFQEFLAAFHLVERVRDLEKIGVALAEQKAFGQSWWRETIMLTAGFLRQGGVHNAEALLREIGMKQKTGDAIARTEVMGVALLDIRSENGKLRRELATRLMETVMDDQLSTPAEIRALAGRTLARLGDPRDALTAREPELVEIPAGAFIMGDEEKRGTHTIQIDQPYQIGKYPVTNGQYRHFIEDGGYTYTHRDCWTEAGWDWRQSKRRSQPDYWNPNYWNDDKWNLDNHPVVGVSWYECVAYAAWLTKATGKSYRLPTEAEWERAARHTDGRTYPWGNEWQENHANSEESQLNRTTAVGVFPAGNAVCGAADMSGNVLEWCQTRWQDENGRNYPMPYNGEDGRENLDGGNNIYHTLRGGQWDLNSRYCRAAYRYYYFPLSRGNHLGFRVVCVLPSHLVRCVEESP